MLLHKCVLLVGSSVAEQNQVTESRIFHQQESFASNKRAVLGDTLEQLVNLGAIQFRPGSLDDHTPVEVLTIL